MPGFSPPLQVAEPLDVGSKVDGVATREKTVLVFVQDRRYSVEQMLITHQGLLY